MAKGRLMLSLELHDIRALKSEAARHGMTVSAFVMRLLGAYLSDLERLALKEDGANAVAERLQKARDEDE